MLKRLLNYSMLLLLVLPFISNAIELPAPTGTYPVGTLIYHWIDSSRHELLAADSSSYRELMAQVWYPSEIVKNPEYAPYIPTFSASESLKKKLVLQGLNKAYIREILSLQTHSVFGAGLSPRLQKYPVVIFSHGNGTNRASYTVFMEELASHGYIVFGLDHPYGAAIVIFPDGHIITQPADYQKRQRFAERVNMWSADQRFALNEIEKLGSGGGIFSGHINFESIAVMGHSLGGISAAKTCSLDKRCKAAINLDGGSGEMSEALESGLDQAFMLMRKADNETIVVSDKQLIEYGMTRQQYDDLIQKNNLQKQTIYQKLKNDAWQVTIRGAAHNNFSDVRLLEHDNKGIDAARALLIANSYILAFLDKYLLQQTTSLLKDNTSPYSEVTVEIFRARNMQ